MIDYNKDGNQEEPDCEICPQWKPGIQDDGNGKDWSKWMCCWHGAYRPWFTNGHRVTHPFEETYKAPHFCPKRMKNSGCTCGRCPECILWKQIRDNSK